MFHWWCSFMDTCKMCKMTSDLMSNVCNSLSENSYLHIDIVK